MLRQACGRTQQLPPRLCPSLLHGLWAELPFLPLTYRWFEHFLPPSTAKLWRMKDSSYIQHATKSWCLGRSWWGNGSITSGVLKAWRWGLGSSSPRGGLALFRVARPDCVTALRCTWWPGAGHRPHPGGEQTLGSLPAAREQQRTELRFVSAQTVQHFQCSSSTLLLNLKETTLQPVVAARAGGSKSGSSVSSGTWYKFYCCYVLPFHTDRYSTEKKSPSAYLTSFISIISGFCLKEYMANIHLGNVVPKMPNREQMTGVRTLHGYSQRSLHSGHLIIHLIIHFVYLQ